MGLGPPPEASQGRGVTSTLAPVPDFRYVGLEPIPVRDVSRFAGALGLGTTIALVVAASGGGHVEAALSGALTSAGSAMALRAAGRRGMRPSGARMGIVPWGVLVEEEQTPRILRWPGVRRVDVVAWRARHSRVIVETERDRFVGESVGAAGLERLVTHLHQYASEQSTPLAMSLGDGHGALDVDEPAVETLLGAAREWLASARGASTLDLTPGGYRGASFPAAGPHAVAVLRTVLRDRSPRAADPRAFAAVVAAEVRATDLSADLVTLTQCPHPLIAAVAKQAARKLGVPRSRTGTLDEVAPFLAEGDRVRLDAWARPCVE